MDDAEAASVGLVHDADHAPDLDQRRAASRLARRLCWVWIVPLAAFTAWYAFILLIFAGFVAEGFEHELGLRAVGIALGIPAGVFAAATGLGVFGASVVGRWLAALMPRAGRWPVAVIAAIAGGALALGAVFLLASRGG